MSALQDLGIESAGWLETALRWAREFIAFGWENHKRDVILALWATVWGITRLAGKTVQSGEVGLKFSFGRAVKVCEPGFYPLIPILQTIRVVPSRARTLDLPVQRLTTHSGLVVEVDANLVYRVLDPRKALIEIDSLERGMEQMLVLSVYEVISALEGHELRAGAELDEQLARVMSRRLEPWGVQVERAGFSTLHPSRETVRITQLGRRAATRAQALRAFAREASPAEALGLLGASQRFISRTRAQRAVEQRARRRAALPAFMARFETFVEEQDDIFDTESKREAGRQLASALHSRRIVR